MNSLIHSSASIHPTSVIESGARLGQNVKIGPYCVVSKDVDLEHDVELISHVTISGRTKIGSFTKIYPFASIGHPPQDLKFKGEDSILIIGKHNTIREYVTIQPGTADGIMRTEIKDHCFFMASSHVAHDCEIGNHVILANNATVAGHVIVNDYVIIGGLSAIHQFVRIGHHAIIGGMSAVEHDVIPYGSVKGTRAKLSGLNLIGPKRRGFNRSTIDSLRSAYKEIFGNDLTLVERVEKVSESYSDNDQVIEIIKFIQSESTRALCVPKNHDQY